MATLLLLLLQAADASEIRACVESLGADSIEEREQAFDRLLAIGEPARPVLEWGLRELDAEGASRARELLDRHEGHRRAVRRVVARWLRLAISAFDREAFDICIQYCDAVLAIDSEYRVAAEISQLAQRASHTLFSRSIVGIFRDWELQTSELAAIIPGADSFRYPSPGAWRELHAHAQGIAAPEFRKCRVLLGAIEVSVTFADKPLEDVLSFLREYSELNLVLDAECVDAIQLPKRVSIEVEDATLAEALDTVLKQAEMDYRVTEEGVVLITTPEKAKR